MIPSGFEILPPWTVLPDDRSAALTTRLHRDLPRGHALYGMTLRAVASRTDQDDVLFELESSPMRLAVVHMTGAWKPIHNGRAPICSATGRNGQPKICTQATMTSRSNV